MTRAQAENYARSMKMRPEHYARLRDAFIRAPARDYQLDTMRGRWDRLWAADLPREWWSAIYAYANDYHIDTALRAIVRELQEPIQ